MMDAKERWGKAMKAIDRELRALLLVSRHVPAFPHSTAIGNRLLKPIYLRKARSEVLADVLDFKMLLQSGGGSRRQSATASSPV